MVSLAASTSIRSAMLPSDESRPDVSRDSARLEDDEDSDEDDVDDVEEEDVRQNDVRRVKVKVGKFERKANTLKKAETGN